MGTATDYATTIGTVAGSGQVHLAQGHIDRQHILCRFGAAKTYTTETISVIPDDGDFRDTLLGAEVKISKLCKNCFSMEMRKHYQARIRQAIAEG